MVWVWHHICQQIMNASLLRHDLDEVRIPGHRLRRPHSHHFACAAAACCAVPCCACCVQVLVTDPKELEAIRQRESDITKERVQKILDAGAPGD